LDETQKWAKLKDQQAEIKAKQREINRLEKVNDSLKKGGVSVDNEMHKFFLETLKTAKPTPGSVFKKCQPPQGLFPKEEAKNRKVKGSNGVRWHPAIIRLALLRSLSISTYDALRWLWDDKIAIRQN